MNRQSFVERALTFRRTSRTPRGHRVRPTLEALERRELLAADTFWTLDSDQSYITLMIPDQNVYLEEFAAELPIGFRNQTGSLTTPWTTNTTHLTGLLATNFADGASIEFVTDEGTVAALPSGNYRPDPLEYDEGLEQFVGTTAAPADIGGSLYSSPFGTRLVYLAISNLTFDASSAPLTISGSSFDASATSLLTTGGDLGFDDVTPFFGDSQSALGTFSDLNQEINGSVTSPSPYERQLTLPLHVPLAIEVGGSPIVAYYTGQIVATTTLPQPPVVDPNGEDLGDYVAAWSGAPVAVVNTANTPSGATISDADSANLASLTIALSRSGGTYLGGDLLTVDTTGTSIVAAPFDGTSLVLSGTDTLANYQQVLRTIQYTNTLGTPGLGVVETVTYTAVDESNSVGVATSTIEIEPASLLSRHIFYNQSFFDGSSAAQGTADDAAIATDKVAYLPNGTTAVFANITSFTRGINGIMVDLAGPGLHASINANDFVFKVGNDNAPSGWATVANTPTISVRVGEGTLGSDRVTITWASGSIRNTWLEVQVLPTANTGLTATDVHFWGNKVGDTGAGTPATTFVTSAADKTSVTGNLASGVGVLNIRDYNRDNNVTGADATTALNNLGNIVRLNVGAGGPFAPEGDGGDSGVASTLAVMTNQTASVCPAPVTPRWDRAPGDERATAARLACFLDWGHERKPRAVNPARIAESFEVDWDEALLDDLVPWRLQ